MPPPTTKRPLFRVVAEEQVEDIDAYRGLLVETARVRLTEAMTLLKRKLSLSAPLQHLIRAVTDTMEREVQPHGYTVIQALSDRARQSAFGPLVAKELPKVGRDFSHGIKRFTRSRDPLVPRQKIQRIAKNAWKPDPGKYRRLREVARRVHAAQSIDDPTLALELRRLLKKANIGQPEKYDHYVVVAFARSIEQIAGRSIPGSHKGCVTITAKNLQHNPLLFAAVAAIEWAILLAWSGVSPPGTTRPKEVKPETVLDILRSSRTSKRTH